MSALAAMSCASALATSGRLASNSDGTPAVTAGAETAARLEAVTLKDCGVWPTRIASASSCCRSCCSNGGMVAATLATTVSCCATSSAVETPACSSVFRPSRVCRALARFARDTQPVAKGDHREVRIRDARHDGQLDGLSVVAACVRTGECRGADGAILAPEVELIGSVEPS